MKPQNFFILLELPFDPPTEDIAQIKTAIHAKSTEWSRLYADPEHKSQALEYIQLIPEIEAVMLDDAKRKEEAEQAAEIRNDMANSFEAELRIYEAKGFIYPKEIKELHDKYRSYGFDLPLVKRLARVPVTDVPVKSPVETVGTLALNYDKAKKIAEHLTILRLSNLYELLNKSESAPVIDIYNAAVALKSHVVSLTENSSENTAKMILCDLAIETFENEETKAAYDTYLKVNTRAQLSDLIYKEFQRSGYISPDVLMRLVNFGITAYGGDVIIIEDYIRNYAKAYDIKISVSPNITCPLCSHVSPRGTAFCSECSSPLEGNCPVCNTFFTDGAKNCTSCGFPVGQMGLALPHVEKARQALLVNDWLTATSEIQSVEKYWPNYKDVNNLKSSLTSVRIDYEKAIENIEINIVGSKFYTAQKLVDRAQSNNFVVPSKIIDHINNTIANFETQLKALNIKDSSNYDDLISLTSKVVDSMELNQLLGGSRPEPPKEVKCKISKKESVNIEWVKSESPGLISYLLVRKENGKPLTAFDGDILYSGENITFEDTTLEPLKNYFYSVFSKRSSSYSSAGAVNTESVIIVPRIKGFTAMPADSSAQLTWSPNSNIKKVNLWRTVDLEGSFKNEPGLALPNTRIDSYTDTDIVNKKTYRYYATAIYKTSNGELVESEVVSAETTPNITQIPMDQFMVLPTEEENRYFVSWEGPEKKDIIFFASKSIPTHNFGQVVALDTIIDDYEQIDIDVHLEKNGRFTLNFVGERYIFPVVVAGKLATIGRIERIVNLIEIQNISYEVLGAELVIKFDWPETEAKMVTLVWRDDMFPKSVDQKGNILKTFTKEEYDKNNAISVPNLEQKNYYFKLFSTLLNQRENTLYSQGVNIEIDNTPAKDFFYRIDYKASVFSKLASISLTISSKHIFRLPKSYLIIKQGSMPLDIHDGKVLFEINRERDLAGAITYKYKSEKLDDNTYVRLFFENEKYYSELRPIPVKLIIN